MSPPRIGHASPGSLLLVALTALLAPSGLSLVAVSMVAAQPNATVDRVARLVERGDAHRAIGDAVSALAFYREAITVGPRRSDGYAALGAMYLELGEPSRALEVFEAGVRSTARGEALWLGYARTLEQLGQHTRALDTLRRFVAVEPSSRAGLRALAEGAERRGAFVEALRARRALLEQLGAARASAPSGELSRELTSERAQVRALERLLGGAERVRARETCETAEASDVARALARCP